MRDTNGFLIACGAWCFGICIGLLVGVSRGDGFVRKEAIDAGAAHYTVNPKTGETSFVWGRP